MADPIAPAVPAIRMLPPDQTEGYCDPVTGACLWPGATQDDHGSTADAPPAASTAGGE